MRMTLRLFVEHANTTLNGTFGTPILASAYRHHIYVAGYTQRGEPLGHPIGGDARLTSIGAIVDGGAWSGTVMLPPGDAYPSATRHPGGGSLSGGNAALNWQIDPASRLGHRARVLARRGRDVRRAPSCRGAGLSANHPTGSLACYLCFG
jgi:hypothetical protein